MPIRIGDYEAQPAVIFDRVHLVRLVVEQPVPAREPTLYSVEIEYRLYGYAADGSLHYRPEAHVVTIPDYLAKAATDPALLAALPAIEQAIAALVAEDRSTNAEVI